MFLLVSFSSLIVANWAQEDCPSPLRPAFIRRPGAIRQIPTIEAKLDMVTCANLCRRNVHPSSEAVLPCRGFNFRVGRFPTCQFFSHSPSMLLEPMESYFHFEKTCLQVPPRCEDATFVVDAKRGVKLKADSDSRRAETQAECLQACFTEDCVAFEWEETARSCRFYKKTRREYEATKSEGIVYMENNCVAPSARCPAGRIDFILARRSDVTSFGVSVGIRSIRACMHECIDSTLFYCRSFQFDPLSSECFVSDEASDEAVPSSKLDLYEPFCSPETADVTCNRPYAYEKILTTKMIGAGELEKHEDVGPEKCLGKCSTLPHCHAVNYDVSRRVCHLLDRQRPQATIGPDENFDFYEVACPPASSTTLPPVDPQYFHLVAKGKELAFHLRHIVLTEIGSVEECGERCRKSGFTCKTFAYSRPTKKCSLSATIITGEPAQFESAEGCSVFAVDGSSSEENFVEDAATRYPTLVSVAAQLEASSEQNIFHMTSKELDELTATTSLPLELPSSPPSTPTLLRSSVTSVQKLIPLNAAADSSLEAELGLLEPGAQPKVLPPESNLGYVNPVSISVEAECFDNGVNITFDTMASNYTGAVYATERFEQCRVLVRNAQQFAIFVPRPSHNTWCNALEHEGQLSVVLVMSNDRVWPLDVTTGNDLFYHISCNYSQSETLHRGIVVGGPSPVSVAPEAVRHSISLHITRKGKPVSNVFIGESLQLQVDTAIPAEDLRIVDCTAHRVGAVSGSIHLIADGCALLPSLMSSMTLGPHGWEATLSAFRVDESEQVDIACMVSVCSPGKCSHPPSCPPAPRSARSLVNQEAIRIDTRLSVYGNASDFLERAHLPPICVQPSIYISILFMLIVFASAALISLVAAIKSRKRSRRSLADAL